MNILFLADAMLPRESLHNMSESNYIQYSSLENVQNVLMTIPHGTLLGPVLLCTIIRNAGYNVKLLECAFHPHQKENLIKALTSEPEVVCLSTTYIMDYNQLSNFVSFIRKESPKSKLILGGPSLIEDPKKRSLGDFFILGEAEENIVPLLKCLEEKKEPKLPGVGIVQDNQISLMPPVLIKNMDEIPFADWSLTQRRPDDFYMLATQRGCNWRCTFCTYPVNEGYKLRYRSTESIISEIKQNYETFGIYRYMFADATFSFPEKRCLEILENISKLSFEIEWAAYVRADNVTPELAKLMKKSGAVGVFVGAESGDNSVLKKMNKGYNVEQLRRGIQRLKELNIPITASWIIGFPGETKLTAQNTLNLIKDLNCDQNMINTFSYYNTAPAGLRPKTFGLEGGGQDWKHETLSSHEARELTKYIIEDVIKSDVHLGNLFDFLWLSSVSWSVKDTLSFFENIQKLYKLNLLNKKEDVQKLNEEINNTCRELYTRAIQHPIYQKNLSFNKKRNLYSE